MTSFEVYPNPISPDCTDCNPNYGSSRGQKGVTIWGPITFTLQAGQTSDPLYFTFTNPKGYNGLHFCNVTYTLRTDRYVYGGDDAGPIEMWINNPTSNPDNSNFSNTNWRENQHYHSKVCFDGTEYHDVTETIDISQGHVGTLLNRSGTNNIIFRNLDPHNVTVTIINFKIVAGYGMNGITVNGDNCKLSNDPPCSNGSIRQNIQMNLRLDRITRVPIMEMMTRTVTRGEFMVAWDLLDSVLMTT